MSPAGTAAPPRPLHSDPLDGATLDVGRVATEPPEARGLRRDGVRLMVSLGHEAPVHAAFTDLAEFLRPGDLVVVNDSATRPAAVDAALGPQGEPFVVHVSTELPAGWWMVEPRQLVRNGATRPLALPPGPHTATLAGGAALTLLAPSPGSARLWLAAVEDGVDLVAVLAAQGRPIRYPYVPRDWPLAAYQTIFAARDGSAEMPSAARPFTPEVVLSLLRRGVGVTTVTLHTGVSSLEGHEVPYPERFEVPETAAAAVNSTRALGGRVLAVGTTVVRALESSVDHRGAVHPARGWTDLVITPSAPVRSVDGLLTGWHEPGASHLAMLEAVAGREPLVAAYRAALDGASPYRWHEFGDSHLLLADRTGR